MPAPRSPLDLFLRFNRMALQGFGGVLAVAQIELVERSGWLTREEFVETLSLAQVLPGPNVCNLALMTGDRFFGWRGAAAALGGMMLVPLAGGRWEIRPGKPVVLHGEDEIGTPEAARILGCSTRRVVALCDEDILREGEDWRRIGPRGFYHIKRAAVLRLAGMEGEAL